ncbi:DUF421 domain-containing protein [Gillisia limnaea]|uniref:YetF C-terminal domain-containing protein n=1 Tax=Gillisia limnaea (strain DSM 15749 / LMG 21470 / R-8282) TaxID=865937 RepID=H2BR21_GILLR|nr:YetF domain-containing protein [Gillisia limnaea]EHQ04340.1 protein of unknown function DUF421 [Gillisia limnaea DSM 15749]
MENWILPSLWIMIKMLISVVAIFGVIIIITRISGLRTFAKMSSFDFASTIAIGSILAAVVMNDEQSILKGSAALSGIVIFQSLFTMMTRKSALFKRYFTNKPMLLMMDGVILHNNLNKTNVGEDALIAKLRKANVINFSEVLAVVLETTGDMSVLHTAEDKILMEKLLQGVEGLPSKL